MAGESSLIKALLENLKRARPEALQRAKSLGFNIETPYYHATKYDFNEFVPSKWRGASYFADTPEGAMQGWGAGGAEHPALAGPTGSGKLAGPNIMPVFIKGRTWGKDPMPEEWFPKHISYKDWKDIVEGKNKLHVEGLTPEELSVLNWKRSEGFNTSYENGRQFDTYVPNLSEDEYRNFPREKELEMPLIRARVPVPESHGWEGLEGSEGKKYREFYSKTGYPNWIVNDEAGRSIAVSDPRNIRSVFSEFNPEHLESADLMKSHGGSAKSPAWTRKEGKNPEGGLNEKGRASLRAAGHDIKRPQPEGGARKDSFCARMKGMREKLTSSETANDPDSRINKSLRKWNCHADGGAIDIARQYRDMGGKLKSKPEVGSEDYWRDRLRIYSKPFSERTGPDDPIRHITPEEYRKGNLGHTEYALSHGGRAGYDTGGSPGITPTNPVISAQDPTANYVRSLYQNLMGRSGDQPGIDYWTQQLNQGNTDQSAIMSQFAASPEFQNLYKSNPSQAITSLYQEALGRAPDQSGLDYWMGRAKTGMALPDMVSGFTGSSEGQNVRDINSLYQEITGQVATPEQIQQALPRLSAGLGTDYFDFLNQTFPSQDPETGVQYAMSGRRSPTNYPEVWGQVSSAPVSDQGRQFLDLIGAGEGGYNTARERTPNGIRPNYNYSIDGKPLSQMTIGDVLAAQKAKKINAAGKYQFVNDTLNEIVQQSGIDPNMLFDQATQDKLALYRAYSRRPRLRAYLEGKSNDRRGAMLDLAAEWRSFPHPDTGRSWDPHNKAQHTIAQIKAALDAARGNMWIPQTANLPNVGSTSGMPGLDPLVAAGAGGNVAGTGAYVAPPTVANPILSTMPSGDGGWQYPGSGTTSGTSTISPIPGTGLPTWDYNTGLTQNSPVYGPPGSGPTLYGSSGSPAEFSGSVSTFNPGGMFSHGGAVDIARSYRKAGGSIWDRPRPKSLGKPEKLSPGEKSSAKAAAKAAGRPYPNLVDNMRAAREDGGRLRPFMEAKIEEIGDKELGKYGIGPNAPASTKDELKAGPEQSTWEKIASKAMGDRPSPERRRFVEGAGNIADVAHMGAYATPLAPYVGAADFARGVASGDPMEAALGATGLPGKGAKAVGVAASAMMPESAEAGPLAKALNAIRAYHGSPHKFDKFDISKIGTGEGAQAYGHGLYFAGNEGVARYYRDALTDPDQLPLQFRGRPVDTVWNDEISNRWNDVVGKLPKGHEEDFQTVMGNLSQINDLNQLKHIRANLDRRQNSILDRYILPELSKPEVGPGHMYEVDIHADPSHMLDWDKPLSEQSDVFSKLPDDIKEQLRLVGQKSKKDWGDFGIGSDPDEFATGQALVHHLAGEGGGWYGGHNPASASEKLRGLGIPGIKYLDQGSRPFASGDGTSNYVVFDPNIIEILRRYKDGGYVE